MFFAALPEPEPEEMPEHRWTPPEWIEPPFDVLPALVPMDRVLARTDHTALTLRGVEVYPNGIRIQLRAVLARRDLAQSSWSELVELANRFHSPRGMLRVGVAFPDGTRAETGGAWPDTEERPSGPVVTAQGGGGGGGSEQFTIAQDVWLWPSPPAAPFTLHWMWTALGIPEDSIELDGAALAEARERVQRLWPETPAG